MGGKLKLLANTFEFIDVINNVADKPYLGLIVGAVSTAAIQSSSATIGILQTIYSEAEGAFPLISAVAILFGNNIGTTITAVLAAIGGSVAAKRTALAHVLFNVIGSILFFLFIRPYTTLIANLAVWTGLEAHDSLVISYAHMGFNIINTLIMFWFIKQLVWIVTFVIRGDDGLIEVNVDSLQEHLVDESPVLALESAKIVIKNMGEVVQEMFNTTVKYSFENEHKLLENGLQYEEILDTIDKKAHDYLVRIAQVGLTGNSSQLHAEYVDTIRDFERIGDHCTNILQFFEFRHEDKVELSNEASLELTKLYDVVRQTSALTLDAFDGNNKEIAQRVFEYEDIIDRLVIKNRKRHIRRITTNESTETQDALYVDILTNIERIGDHCNNIAINIIQDHYYNEEMDYEVALDE